MARSADEIRWQTMGSSIYFANREGGKPAAEAKARKMFEGKTTKEIQRMTSEWNSEALNAIAGMLPPIEERLN